jgi:hypothetical protein
MHILLHLGTAILFGCLYLLGKLMIEGRELWAAGLSRISASAPCLCKVFLFGGRIFEVVASIGVFLETIAVMILVGGSLIDLFVGM